MKLSVPANFDLDLISSLSKYSVREIYGKMNNDFLGGGRPSYCGQPVSWGQLKEYVQKLKKNNIEFNYLLNAACLGNEEWNRNWQKKLNKLLEDLSETGISRVTISIPLLLKIIKRRFPHFYCKTGIYAQVDTVSRAKYWEELGADEITLESFSINRNFNCLRKIRGSVKCGLQLIVNHPCLSNCPMQFYHQNGFAHSSNGSKQIFIDYCLFFCSYLRLKEPANFIKSQWIRPDDLDFYESLGFDSFKLLERNIPSEQLLKRIEAYSQKDFKGNLAELIMPYGFTAVPRKEKFWFLRYFFRPFQIRPWKLRDIYEYAKLQGMSFPAEKEFIKIDSKKIPADFLFQIEKNNCPGNNCDSCGYCKKITEHAVSIDKEYRDKVLKKFEQIDNQILSGDLWNV